MLFVYHGPVPSPEADGAAIVPTGGVESVEEAAAAASDCSLIRTDSAFRCGSSAFKSTAVWSGHRFNAHCLMYTLDCRQAIGK
jgi:hypothetical protein